MTAVRATEALGRWEEYRWTNAFVHVDPDAVRRESAAVRDGHLRDDLFSVKDLFAVSGVPSRAGSLALEGYRPRVDATVVRRVRRVGARFFGKSNCAEFGFGTDTETRLGGRVRHPWRDDLSPGGSSGGDAVAVATGVVDFALAGDYGGSIRWPAQALGIYGLRPGVGATPGDGRIGGLGADFDDPLGLSRAPWQLSAELEVIGVMARTPRKIGHVMQAITGPPTKSQEPQGRILVTDGTEIGPVREGVRKALAAVEARARDDGLTTDDAEGLFIGALEAYATLRARLDDHSDVRRIVRGREDLLCSQTRAVLDNAPPEPRVDTVVRDAWAAAMRIRHRIHRSLAEYDAVIVPCAPSGAVGFGEPVQVGMTTLTGHELMGHCRAVSLTGLPSLVIPTGCDDAGRPVSVQLVGAMGSELRLCALAERLAAVPHPGPATIGPNSYERTP
ncbi:amidase [Gordonia sp. CPCC 206044]|uniref:amidase n=1 Tax=Gordonia sp. CPCC 206044 TaxID=3140793 RepID=UPI003AF35591